MKQNLHFSLSLTFLILCSSGLAGCMKKRNTVDIRLYVCDAETGEPLSISASLNYTIYTNPLLLGTVTDDKTVYLNGTDASGQMEEKIELPRKAEYPELVVYRGENYSPVNYGYSSGISFPVRRGKNFKVLTLGYYYSYLITASNTSCFDATDSVVVSISEGVNSFKRLHTGCGTETFKFGISSPYTMKTAKKNLQLHIWSKKNGVVTESDRTVMLQRGSIVPVLIEY